jgi:hypothetical protein
METGELISRIRAHLDAGGPQVGLPKSKANLPPPPPFTSVDQIRAYLAAGNAQIEPAKIKPTLPPLPPPATEDELLKAEELIGFPLPPLLRALYSEIANGGFGPGYGLIPLFKYPRARQIEQGAIDMYTCWREADFDMESDDAPAFSWPAMLIPFNDWGCNIRSCVDCSKPDLPILRSDPNKSLTRRSKESPSLETWLLDWLDGKSQF